MTIGSLASLFHAVVKFSVRISGTRANYWAEFILDSLLSIAMITAAILLQTSGWLSALMTFLAGLFVFSFIEYFFHRRMFHVGDTIFVRGHTDHHNNPLGYDALPFYFPMLIFSGLLGLSLLFLPLASALMFVGAMMLGYILYGSSHYIIHHVHFRSRLLRAWAAYHHIHHVHPDKNFGVTSPLWDKLLGTLYVSRRNRTPKSM